jgi:hypothetical protein
MDPDYEELDQEFDESVLDAEPDMTELELLADHMPRWRHKRNTEISVIDIAQLGYSIERLIERWRNKYWPVKKGDPG